MLPGTFLLLSLILAVSSGQPAAHYAGCSIFTPGDVYNARVDHAPIDPHSEQYIQGAMDAGNTGGFWAAAPAARIINIADSSTPRVTVHQKVPYHRFTVQYPWSTSFRIEPLNDAHAIVLDVHDCRLYETYDTTYAGVLSAYGGAMWDLRKPFQPMPPGSPSAMASGLSLFAGMIKWEEIRAGRIDHALNWSPPAGTVAQWSFVPPASDTDGVAFAGSSRYQLPYGARLRLKRDFDDSHFGPQALAIAEAMKTYGIFLADTGHDDNALYNSAPISGPDQWDGSDLAALRSIRLSDFDLLRLPAIQQVPH